MEGGGRSGKLEEEDADADERRRGIPEEENEVEEGKFEER